MFRKVKIVRKCDSALDSFLREAVFFTFRPVVAGGRRRRRTRRLCPVVGAGGWRLPRISAGLCRRDGPSAFRFAAEQLVSKEDLKTYKNALVKGIQELLTRQGEVAGKQISLTTDISAKVYSSEEAAAKSGRDNLVAVGYDAIQTDKLANGVAFGIEGENFDRMAMSVTPDGANYRGAYQPIEEAKNTAAHEFAAHLLRALHNSHPGEDASLFSDDGGNGAVFNSDLTRLIFGYDDSTYIPPPPPFGQKPVPPSYALPASGRNNRRANAIYPSGTDPADVYRWVSRVKR